MTWSIMSCLPLVAALSGQPVLKERIINLARGTANGLEASAETKSEIITAAAQLEATTRWSRLARSRLLDGRWQLLFTTTQGNSAGKLGPFVGDVFQDIDTSRGVYVNTVALPLVEGRLGATWDVTGPSEWTVIFQDLAFSVFGAKVVDKDLAARGIWRMTYVDDDFRILWARGETKTDENIYILQRVAPRRGIDPVVGKAIGEKTAFLAAAAVSALLIQALT